MCFFFKGKHLSVHEIQDYLAENIFKEFVQKIHINEQFRNRLVNADQQRLGKLFGKVLETLQEKNVDGIKIFSQIFEDAETGGLNMESIVRVLKKFLFCSCEMIIGISYRIT